MWKSLLWAPSWVQTMRIDSGFCPSSCPFLSPSLSHQTIYRTSRSSRDDALLCVRQAFWWIGSQCKNDYWFFDDFLTSVIYFIFLKKVYECENCKQIVCLDCDLFIRETLHTCPGCASDPVTAQMKTNWIKLFHSFRSWTPQMYITFGWY